MRRLNFRAGLTVRGGAAVGGATPPEDGETGLAARSLGYLFLAGAGIGMVSLLLPTSPKANVGGLWSNVAVAFVGGVVLLLGVSRIKPWMLQVALAAGSLLITRAVLLSGVAVSFYSVWFIWVGLYAFFFFTRRVAAAHVAFVAVLYGATLFHHTPSSPIARWLTTVSTLIVAGVFIDTLVRRARQQASVAAESARAMAQVSEFAHGLAALSDPEIARQELCQGTMRVTQAVRASLWEPREPRDELEVTASAGARPAYVGASAATANSLRGLLEAFTTGRPVTAPSPRSGGAALWRPIVREAQSVAVLELEWSDPVILEDRGMPVLTELLAVEAAVTLERVELIGELEAIARTDELTGLPNRRAWEEQLPREVMRADRSEAPLSVAMLDLDHFKDYNDSQGHQSGDTLLKEVAGAWLIELRPTDILSRYGGEEFALALPGCPSDEALDVVERLRASIPAGQTCSAGIATWERSETAAELLGRADRALYYAKRSGRNQSATAPAAGAGTPVG
ncbi:MAG: diguanylate cyclase [Solirubrobacteraceae bacterium]